MRTGSLRTGAGLAVLLLAGTVVRAQTMPPAGGPVPVPGGVPVGPGATAPNTRPWAPPPGVSVPPGLPATPTPIAAPAPAALVPPGGDPLHAPPPVHEPEGLVPVAEPLHPEPHGGEIHPPEVHRMEGECNVGDAGFIGYGDYLYMRARRNDLDFAVLGSSNIATPFGTVESANWQTQSGFRVGAAYRLPHDEITFGAEYTYLHTNGSNIFGAPPGGTLFATQARAGGVDDVQAAAANTNLDYNVLDILVGKKFCVGESFDMRFFGGARLAMIDQKFDILYNGGTTGANNYHVSVPQYFHGAGLTAGGEGTWRLYRGLGLYARGQGSLVSGQFRTFHTETNANETTLIVNVNEKYEEVVPVVELGFGVSVEYSEHVFMKVGYELVNWFSMVHQTDLNDGTGVGRVTHRDSDLSLEGLRFELGLVF